MCLGTLSRLRRSLATSTLYAAVHILAERFLLCRKAVSCKVKNRCQKDNGFPAHFYSVILRLPQMFTVLTIQRVLRL